MVRRNPFERRADFGNGLVAMFVQLRESLLLRLQALGPRGRPGPVDIEFPGR
jgi:hypothetical protein